MSEEQIIQSAKRVVKKIDEMCGRHTIDQRILGITRFLVQSHLESVLVSRGLLGYIRLDVGIHEDDPAQISIYSHDDMTGELLNEMARHAEQDKWTERVERMKA